MQEINPRLVIEEANRKFYADSFHKMLDDMAKKVREMEDKKIVKALEENNFFVGDWKVAMQIKEAFPDAKVTVAPGAVEEDKIIMVQKAFLQPPYYGKEIPNDQHGEIG